MLIFDVKSRVTIDYLDHLSNEFNTEISYVNQF